MAVVAVLQTVIVSLEMFGAGALVVVAGIAGREISSRRIDKAGTSRFSQWMGMEEIAKFNARSAVAGGYFLIAIGVVIMMVAPFVT